MTKEVLQLATQEIVQLNEIVYAANPELLKLSDVKPLMLSEADEEFLISEILKSSVPTTTQCYDVLASVEFAEAVQTLINNKHDEYQAALVAKVNQNAKLRKDVDDLKPLFLGISHGIGLMNLLAKTRGDQFVIEQIEKPLHKIHISDERLAVLLPAIEEYAMDSPLIDLIKVVEQDAQRHVELSDEMTIALNKIIDALILNSEPKPVTVDSAFGFYKIHVHGWSSATIGYFDGTDWDIIGAKSDVTNLDVIEKLDI